MSGKTLLGKKILVTGASQGIGATIAQMALQEGAYVVLTARNKPLLEDAAGKYGVNGHALVVAGDITDPAFQDKLVDAAVEKYKGIDVLIHNAGIVEFAGLNDITEEVLAKHFKTNFFSTVSLTQRVVPHIPIGGSIVFISTSITDGGFPGLGTYSASKAAMLAYMRTLAVELKDNGIAVNAVSPGPTKTELWSRALPPQVFDAVANLIKGRLLTGDFADPEDVAATTLFLAQRGDAIRGQTIVVDGGYSVS